METIVNLFKHQRTAARSSSSDCESNDGVTAQSQQVWSGLPYVVMLEVAKYLKDQDRVAASQVCKNWHIALKDSSLWKGRAFIFGGPIADAHGTRAVKFAKLHRSHLKHVNIQCVYNPAYPNESITRTLRRFLNLLRSSRLLTLRVECAELMGRWTSVNYRKKLAPWIGTFLRTQSSLKMFGLVYALFPLEEGIGLLQDLSSACTQILQCLELVAYFAFGANVIESRPYVDALKGFNKLVIVHMSYGYINDEILQEWAKHGHLTDLHLLIHSLDPHGHIIRNETWRQLRRTCPDLVVFYSIMDVHEATALLPLFQPSMPLTRLVIKLSQSFEGGPPLRREQQLAIALHRVSSHYNHQLQDLVLDLANSQEASLDAAVVSLITNCRTLVKVHITACLGDRAWQAIERLRLQPRVVVHTSRIDRQATENVNFTILLDQILP